MAKERVGIHIESYKKSEIETVVDTEFTTFVKATPLIDTDTVNEFFRLYDKLFYSIPVEGEKNSHQYILTKSSELATLEKSIEDIQPLLNEIGQLRRQLLDANEQIFELEK
tara:strand:+ start:1095 stop:1427 length:333 start_codon:yes stop_codon:yes gene_type:complete